MSCDWRDKVTLYVDDELGYEAHEEMASHVRSCAECAAAVAEQSSFKKTLRMAGNRFTAPPGLRASVYRTVRISSGHSPGRLSWQWTWALAMLALVAALGLLLFPKKIDNPLVAELVDQHITATASNHPVDVISSDRHTVKPWFQGKLPYTFNLPELANSPFTLVGGKVAYVGQAAGAELLYQVRQHKISVFIFQPRAGESKAAEAGRDLSFTFNNWSEGGLQYYLVTDATRDEADRLVSMFQEANRRQE